MAHTDAHTPYRVLQERAFEEGRVVHDHSRLGLTYEIDRPSFWENRKLSKTFYKWATKEIGEYCAYLDGLKEKFVYTLEEDSLLRPVRVTDFCREPGYDKVIKITVFNRIHRVVRYTSYCTDYEHYDPRTKTDTRDGGLALCAVGDPTYEEFRSYHYGRSYRVEHPSKTRAVL